MAFSGLGYGRSQAGGNSSEEFPDPFQDVASLAMPTNMRSALHWVEFIYSSMGTYRMAMERVLSYFLTDIEIGGDEVSSDEKDKWESFLKDTLDTFTVLQNLLRDKLCYGNAFASLIVPFKRFLKPPDSGDMWPLKEVTKAAAFKFEWSNFQFIATN